MKTLVAFVSILIALPALAAEQFDNEQAAQRHCPGDVIVWVNLLNGKVHPKGGKWYGRTRSGAYVCNKELIESAAPTQASASPKSEKRQGWLRVVDDGMRTVYAAAAPQERRGARVTMLALVDLRQAAALSNGKQFLSWETQYEFDCDKKLYRIVAASM